MGIGISSLILNGGLAVWQEGGRMSSAIKQGKTGRQLLGSTINFGKWLAIPSALAMLNPTMVAASAAIGLAGFILPNFIPDIDFTENKEGQEFSAVG